MIKIIPKKKVLFWRLTIFFIGITLLTLLGLWGSSPWFKRNNSMMTESMGNMMLQMHTQNISIGDLFVQKESAEQMTGMKSHHSTADKTLQFNHYLTTLFIVLSLPFVLAGGVFLLIVWWK